MNSPYDEIEKLLSIFGLILFLFTIMLMLMLVIEEITKKNIGYKTVDCYDKFENKIINQVCKQEVNCGIITKKLNPSYCEVKK